MTAPFLRLLGPPALVLHSADTGHPGPGVKGLALLAYLTLEPGPHSRDELAALLWGESPDSAARGSLRQVLLLVRQNLGDVLRVDRQTVELPTPPTCDVITFLQSAATDRAEAVKLEVPRFLSGFSLRDAPAFDEWADRKRRELLLIFHQALHRLAQESMAKSRWQEAAGWAGRWLASDPLSDQATRLLLETLYLSGDRAGALARFHEYRERLSRELDSPPSGAILALAERIEAGARATTAVPSVDAPPRRMPAFESPLTGREAQWAELAALWNSATTGRGRIALVEGVSGLGKSRLAEEFLHWVLTQGGTVVRGRAYDPRGGIPYAPIAEALRGLLEAPGLAGTAPEWLAEASRLLPELRRRYPGLPEPLTPDDPGERWRLFEGIAQLVLGVAAERPTLLLIDDLHRGDAESCALLRFLARRLEQEPVLMLLTVDPGELDDELPAASLVRALQTEHHATRVGLQALSGEEVWRLLHDMGKIKAPGGGRRFAQKVFELSQGNPAYTIELVKTLFAAGVFGATPLSLEWIAWAPTNTNEFRPIDLPRSVRDSIAARIGGLTPPMREMLDAVAVAGQPVSPELLAEIGEMSRLKAVGVATALVKRDLLVEEEGRFRCTHRIVEDVVQAELTPASRRELHRGLALGLLKVTPADRVSEVAGRVAKHAEQGDEPALAHRYGLAAAAAAAQRYAFEEALGWLDLARANARADAERDVVEGQAAALLQAAGWNEMPSVTKRRETREWRIRREDLDLRIVD